MKITRKLSIEVVNESGEDLKVTITAADGKLTDENDIPDTLYANGRMTIKARRSATFGPKMKIELTSGEKKAYIYAELSIDSNNPRCCYAIPDKDFVFEGCQTCYWFTEHDHVFSTKVVIGKFQKLNTFYHISDTHIGDEIGDEWNAKDGESDIALTMRRIEILEAEYDRQKILMEMLNQNCGIPRDESTTEVGEILGIIHTGDIFGTIENKDCFEPLMNKVYKKIYRRAEKQSEVSDTNRLRLHTHLFEGVGNHDDTLDGDHIVDVWADVLDRSDRDWKNGDHTVDSRMPSVTHSDGVDNKYKRCHYSWNWHGVEFIHINFSVVDGKSVHNSSYKTYGYNSYDYLKERLKEIKEDTSVIICCHIGLRSKQDDFYPDEWKCKFEEIVREYSNIAAILCGHTHNSELNKVKEEYSIVDGGVTRKILNFDAGKACSGKRGRVNHYCALKYIFDDDKEKINVKRITCNGIRETGDLKIVEEDVGEILVHIPNEVKVEQ